MATLETQDQQSDGSKWPQNFKGNLFAKYGIQEIQLYYYPDQNGHIDINKTLRTMMWLLNHDKFNLTTSLSAYFSIMHIFTYPELSQIADKLPKLAGLKLVPTSFLDTIWSHQNIPDVDKPLSGTDVMYVLAAYTLLLEFEDQDSHIRNTQEVTSAIGLFESDLLSKFVVSESWKLTNKFMTLPFFLPLSKHMYETLLQNAAQSDNKKAEQMLRLCGQKMPKLLSCRTVFIQPPHQ